jgi:hypothetical protein
MSHDLDPRYRIQGYSHTESYDNFLVKEKLHYSLMGVSQTPDHSFRAIRIILVAGI